MAQKFEYTVLELIESASRNLRALPLNLGGVGGAGGGAGLPAGGIIGQLPQYRISYDESEISSSGTAPSGVTPPSGWSLLDNLNHIRYRLSQVEAGSGVFVVEDNDTIVENVNTITFSGGVTVVDLGGGHALVNVTASGGGGSFTSTPNRFAVFDSSGDLTTDSGLYFDYDTKSIVFGIKPPTYAANYGVVQTAPSGVSGGYLQFSIGMSETIAPFYSFMRALGDYDNPQAVTDGTIIGRLRGRPHDGSNFENTQVELRYAVVGDHNSSNHGTAAEIYTTPSGSTTLTKVITFKDDGDVNIASGHTYNVNDIPHTHTPIFQRNLMEDLVLNDGEAVVTVGYINLNGHDIYTNGDSAIGFI